MKARLWDVIISLEMVGSTVGSGNLSSFNQVENKPEIMSHYLSEFYITYKPESWHGGYSLLSLYSPAPPIKADFSLKENSLEGSWAT